MSEMANTRPEKRPRHVSFRAVAGAQLNALLGAKPPFVLLHGQVASGQKRGFIAGQCSRINLEASHCCCNGSTDGGCRMGKFRDGDIDENTFGAKRPSDSPKIWKILPSGRASVSRPGAWRQPGGECISRVSWASFRACPRIVEQTADPNSAGRWFDACITQP